MVLAAGAFLIGDSKEADASTSYIQGETNVVAVEGSLTYKIMFFETADFDTLSLTFTAVVKDSNDNSLSGLVSPSSGSLNNGVESSLTITAPKTPGKFTLEVTFKSTINDGTPVSTVKTQAFSVVEPVVLKATLKNIGDVDFTDFVVYFKIDGNLLTESKTTVSVAANSTTEVSYNMVVEYLANGKHTFQVVAGSENIGGGASFIGGEGVFWKGSSDYGLMNIMLGLLLVVLIIAVIWFYRKPVKNYGKQTKNVGKPRSRR
ncbi:MAG: hypothetical protein FWC44_03090 [Methanomassiliicoccaceae archaeon]|nr:hypothetical protein [Methanomassiliicoccaceae archaeon]